MLEVFSELNAKYPQLDAEFSSDIKKMIDALTQGLAMNSQEEEDGLRLGVDISGMLLFLAVRSRSAEKGLPALQYLRKYHGTIGAPKDLKKCLSMYLVEYLPYLAEVMTLSRENVEAYFRDARKIIVGSDTPIELLEVYQLRALRAMGDEEKANEQAKTWREKGWNYEASNCESCVRTQKVWVALAYQDLEQAQKLTDDWVSGELRTCTRGPADVLAAMALASFRAGHQATAETYAREQEKVLSTAGAMHTWFAVIPLFEYYVEAEEWEAAQRWMEDLAPTILSSVFSILRLRFLRGCVRLLEHYQSTTQTAVVFPPKLIPISSQADGRYATADLTTWMKNEVEAVEEMVARRNA